jgi:ABC-type dipeptide/oligopeptide/nickel transport system permease subunit
VSLILFSGLFVISLLAEALSNDKPLVVRYDGQWYFPLFQTLPDTTFGGDFPTPADFLDPFIRENLAKPGNFAVFPPNPYHHSTINYFAKEPNPAAPGAQNILGTDDRGRDLLARLLYGFRISVVFAMLVAGLCTVFGVLYGAIQGYFAGWTDIAMERFNEIWGAMPVLYMLIILSSLFAPSFWLLVLLLSLFGWLGIAAYVRAEFLKNRTLDYVRAARALGQSKPQDHAASYSAEQSDAGRDAHPVRAGCGDRLSDSSRFSGTGHAARHTQPGRAPLPGQGQPVRLVDIALDLHRAGGDLLLLILDRRRAARRAGSAQGPEGDVE